MRRSTTRAIGRALPLVVAASLLTPTGATAGEPDWRERLAATAGADGGLPSDLLKRRVAGALRPATTPPLDASGLDGLLHDAESAYVDGVRLVDAATADRVLSDDGELAADLQVLLNRGGGADVLSAAADVLAAARGSAAATLADAEAVAGERGGPQDDAALRQGRTALDAGVAAWGRGQPVSAVAHFRQAADRGYDTLARHGLAYTEDADADGDGVPDLLELRFGGSAFGPDGDGDGLSDHFEIQRATGAHLPSRVDTDGDGTADPLEDLDGDHLTAAEEQARGTNPLSADTDGDGLDDADEGERSDPLQPDTDGDGATDSAEARVGTDPRRADTDGDGTLDGADVATGTVVDGSGVRVALTGVGDLAGAVSIQPVADPALRGAPGQVGEPVEVHLDDRVAAGLDAAALTLPFDPQTVTGDPQDLRVFTYDEALGLWVPAGDAQAVDLATGTVTTTVPHFSVFAIFDVRNWQATLTALGGTCEGRGGTGGGGQTVLADVALVLDSSGSMLSNDPQNLRRAAAKQFIDALLPEDRAAVVRFASTAVLLQSLTSDKALLRAAVDRVNASGGTNIGDGVRVGLSALAGNTDTARAQLMILLTDGDGSYSSALTTQAAEAGVTIYTVGLGGGVNASLLQGIAQGTGGSYYAVADAADLPEVFRTIEEDTGDDGRDTDGDGLSDCDEETGIADASGLVHTSDPRLVDTDEDGLEDGEEMGARPSGLAGALLGPLADVLDVRTVSSSPRLPDTDGDGLTDPQEADRGTRARSSDTDGDGLSDRRESDELGTDPTERDTDGDGREDGWEVDNASAGFDPQIVDVEQSKWDYAADFVQGATCPQGWTFCEDDTVAWLAGTISGGFAAYKDVLDFIGSVTTLDVVGAGLSAASLVPWAGDAVSVVSKAVRFLKRVSSGSGDALRFLFKLDGLPLVSKIDILRQVDAGTVNRLRSAGLSDEAITTYATKRLDFRLLDEAVAGAAATPRSPALYGVEKHAEDYLRQADPDALPKQRGFRPPGWQPGDGTKGYRYPDVYNPVTQTAIEVKNGYWDAVEYVREQIKKDLVLIADPNTPIQRVEWHFFPHTNGGVGPSRDLLDLLTTSGIPYVIHIP